MADSSFKIYVQALLDKVKSLANIKSDIKSIEPKLKIKIQGTLDSAATKKELNSKLKTVKPKIKVDADTSAVTKKMKQLEKAKTETTIKPKVDNSDVISSLKQTQKETKSLFDRFMSGAVGVNLVRMSIQKVTQANFQAIQAAKELDAIKTNIQMVSGTTDTQVDSMMSSYNALAKELSSTTKEVGEAANEFLRMGESIETTNELIKSSQILAKVGMIDSSDAASYLISSLKGYKVAAEDSIDIVSKLTSVDLEAAVSAGGLAEALSRCANIANNSGTSMDRLIGYAAAIGETTQESMSVVGNALKSIYSRMSNIKIGRFIDDETGESLSDTEAVLNKLDIKLRDTADTYRSFDDVLDDIGKRWSSFTQVEQNAISVAMAGNVQRERFIALMNNFSTALEYSEVAANSAGSALERYAVYQESIEAKTNELTAAIESLSTNIISEELYSGIIDATTGIVEFLDKTNLLKGSLAGFMAMGISNIFISLATGIITAAKSTSQLTTAMALFDKGRSIENLKAIGKACVGLSDKQFRLVLSTKGLENEDRLLILAGKGVEEQERQQTLATLGFAAAEDKATFSTFSLKGAFRSLGTVIATNPIGVIVTAVSVATMVFTKFNSAMDETRQKAKELGKEFSNTKSEIEDYKEKIEALHKTINDSGSSISDVTEARKNLMVIQDELIEKFGNEEEAIKNITDAINEQAGALDELTKKQWQETINKFNDGGFWNDFVNWLDYYDNNIDRMVDTMENTREILSFSYNDFVGKNGDYSEIKRQIEQLGWVYENTLGGYVKEGNLENIYSDVLKIQDLVKNFDAPDMLVKDLTKDANKIKETIDDYGDMWDTYILRERIFADDSLADSFNKINKTYSNYQDAFVSGDKQAIEEALEVYASAVNSALDNAGTDESVKEYFRNMYPAITSEVEKWNFRFKILPDYDIHALNGKTQAEILQMLQTDGLQYGEQTFNSLLRLAGDYGIIIGDDSEKIKQLLDLLVEWEILQGNIVDQDTPPVDPPSFFTQLNNSKDSLDKFQSSVKSASDAYATLLSGNYSSSDLLDSIQIINQAVSDMKGTLDWEEIGSLDELQDKLEDVSRSYAESILSGTGIDIESDFGKMLTDIIQKMYEVEAKFTGMNAQFDRLQASYSTLTDAIEYYNETGFINLDTLQSLLTADENLIKMLEVESGQLVINQEAYEELVAVQLLEFKEKLDNVAAAEIEALALSKAEEATNNNAQASEDAVAKLDAETEAFKRNTEAASENAITKAIANAEDAGVSEEEIQNILDKYDEVWNAAINNYHKDFPTFMLGRDKSGSGSGSGSSSSSSKDFEETFDWIETAIDRIERSISNLNLKASSVYRSWSERNSNLKAELLDVKKEMDIQASGYNRYMQQANSVGLSEEWASKVRNGQIDINTITDETLAKQIKQYQDYYEKAIACSDAVESLRESISKLYETAFDNIVSQFDSIVSVIENSKSMLDEQINQAEERGYIANVAYYEALIKVEQKNIEQLTKERTSLQSALADAVSNGAIAEGSQEWADMTEKNNDVTLSIEQANTAMIKYGNSIRDIQWQIFDLIQDRISRISSESDFLINLLSYDKQYDDRGQLTDTGMSTVGLHGMNYNVYMAQADKYAEEMLRINEELAKDPNNLELYNRKAELIELQQESIIAAENEKQAIVDMVEEGINLELDALKELISTYKDCLDSAKDLHDYQKNLAKQADEVAKLEKIYDSMNGDLSEENKAKLQQIKVQLENAKEQLEETEYGRFLDDQRRLLDDLYLEYETALNQRLDNIDALIADMIASSNAKAGMISDTLSSKADSVGYYLSESMEDIWNTNTGSMLDALAMYDSNIMGGFAEVNTSVGEVIRGVTETVSGIGKVDTTINNAINSVTGNMQAILDKLSAISTMQSASAASSYYGSSGGTSSGDNGSGNGSSGSGSSGSGGSGGSGFFIYSRDSYPKQKLNKDTSIIDRLRYLDYDYSFSARSQYYSKMGLPGTYTGTAAQNVKMLDWMKLNGYKNGVLNLKQDELAWTQEGGKPEMITYPNGVIVYKDGTVKRPDGSELKILPQGANVFPADASKILSNFAHNPSSFLQDQIRNMFPPVPQNIRQDTINNDIQLTVELPNVQNYEQFKYALQHDRQFTAFVKDASVGEAAGRSSLRKYHV